ncbi:hypothetical protein HaLaN_33093 [Haematococcus lacustris]|uniref:Uncharacterized protein n=1 Tax=Haematococcus lacustris TaxID=44745 RepID=A0A6A0ALG0_HAELA|nr:hypothetical protein HaLaN_33093 [Haematococcus lacustris]
MVPRQAPTISPEAIEEAQPLLDTSTPEGLQNQFLLLVGVNGMFRNAELHNMKRCHFELHKDSRDPVGRETYKVDCLAIKNVQGGMKDANYTIKPKYIVPNPSYSPTGDVYADAKVWI